jgi:hypothetical protein
MESKKCPFQIGDKVIYTPSSKGIALEVNSPPTQRLKVRELYTVDAIIDGVYVVVVGYNHPGTGLYWSEFSLSPQSV